MWKIPVTRVSMIPMNNNIPIDIVYTWVEGNNEEYQALYRSYAGGREDLNPERYRDCYSLMKYSMRSVEQFVPWVRRIHVLTCRPQIPEWLDLSNPRIRVIHHDQVFDSKEYLPTFNTNVIESYLHLIPELSDPFIYMNDDFLFGRETYTGDFMDEQGRIKIFGTLLGERLKFRVYQGRFNFISYGFVEHTPILILKHAWASMLNQRPGLTHRTRQHRFRAGNDLQMDKLYRYHMLSSMRDLSCAIPFYELTKIHRFHKITNCLKAQVKGLDRLRHMRPKFYCLNDDQRDLPDEAVVELVKEFLEGYYPQPSSFEK